MSGFSKSSAMIESLTSQTHQHGTQLHQHEVQLHQHDAQLQKHVHQSASKVSFSSCPGWFVLHHRLTHSLPLSFLYSLLTLKHGSKWWRAGKHRCQPTWKLQWPSQSPSSLPLAPQLVRQLQPRAHGSLTRMINMQSRRIPKDPIGSTRHCALVALIQTLRSLPTALYVPLASCHLMRGQCTAVLSFRPI